MKKRRLKKKRTFLRKKKNASPSRWERRKDNHAYVLDYLLTHPCVDCGESDIVVLEFDHIDPKKKRGTITSLLHLSLDCVKKEIAKCAIRCCNCHRRRTAVQMGWKRTRMKQTPEDADGGL